MKHLFILNPAAGKGRTVRLIPEINSCCESRGLDYQIAVTEYPGHATEIAAAYSKEQPLRIYSVGGDGTLNEVLNGMAGSGSSLGVIPSGSGNDFIRSIPGTQLKGDLVKQAVEGTEQFIDYGRVNDKYFINISSLGFDAEVVYQTGHYKKLPLITGELAYMLGILTTILVGKSNYMEVRIDDRVISGKSLLTAVGIGRFYGGGILALPDAVIDDGLLDVCYVEEMKRLKILHLFPQYMKGRHASIKGVHLYKAKRVEIALDKPIPMNRDGEIVLVDRAVFEIFPKGLSFLFPPKG
jgi:YegS/Rv2252/BmrU family lipid kinase